MSLALGPAALVCSCADAGKPWCDASPPDEAGQCATLASCSKQVLDFYENAGSIFVPVLLGKLAIFACETMPVMCYPPLPQHVQAVESTPDSVLPAG